MDRAYHDSARAWDLSDVTDILSSLSRSLEGIRTPHFERLLTVTGILKRFDRELFPRDVHQSVACVEDAQCSAVLDERTDVACEDDPVPSTDALLSHGDRAALRIEIAPLSVERGG